MQLPSIDKLSQSKRGRKKVERKSTSNKWTGHGKRRNITQLEKRIRFTKKKLKHSKLKFKHCLNTKTKVTKNCKIKTTFTTTTFSI